MPAVLEAWRAGLLRRENWMSNLLAGVVVGVVSIPLSMAFAIASGAKPEQGLYTAAIAALIVALFGGTRVQIAGPTGAFVVLLYGVTAEFGFAGLQVASMMAGVILVAFGLSKLGSVIRFIPEPVILGFTAGVAVVIWVGQWQSFFGLPAVEGEHFFDKLLQLFSALPHLHPATTLFGLVSLAVIVFWPKLPVVGKVPGPIVALVAATVVQAFVHVDGVATIGSAFGGVPTGLPMPHLPSVDFAIIIKLIQPAFAIALLGAIESLLSAAVSDGMTGTRSDSNQELVGQGLANIASGVFGGFAATGAIARTATNVRHGGTSPIAGIASSITILLVLLVLAPLAYSVPLATLAAILFVVAWNMSQAKQVARIVKRAPKADVGIMLITLGLTVFADLVLAVNVGVILAMLNFLRRMASSVEVRPVSAEECAQKAANENIDVPEDVIVYTIEGPFFYAAVQQFEGALVHTHTEPRRVVISMERVPFIDLTGILAIKDVADELAKRGVEVALCCANELVRGKLERAEVAEKLVFPVSASLAEAIMTETPQRAA